MTYEDRLEDAISAVQVHLEDNEDEMDRELIPALELVLDAAWRYLEVSD